MSPTSSRTDGQPGETGGNEEAAPESPGTVALGATRGAGAVVIGGRWRLERLLGQGGMSEVFAAVDETGGLGPVAVKVVRSSDRALARRLADEARALRAFDHPNLVRLLAAGTDGGQAYLVTELISGPTLASRLRGGPLPPVQAAAVGRGLAAALEYVHGRGFVHRDVKPANVLLGRDRALLADFGIARLLDAASITVTGTGTTVGTVAYMAPEQIKNSGVGPPADIWSLGITLVESLTGSRMFEGTPAEVIARRLATGVQLPPDLPVPWRLLLTAMLEPVPADRPTATEVLGLIGAAGFEAPWHPAPGSGAVPPRKAGGQAGGPRDRLAAEGEPPGTLVGDATNAPSGDLRRHRRRFARVPRWAVPLVVLASVAIALVAWPASGTRPPGGGTRAADVLPKETSTTAPTIAQDAGALERDIEQGIESGTIRAAPGEELLNELNQVILAIDNLNPVAAASGLGTIDALVGGGASSGAIAPGEASRLAADVSALSQALKITDIATTTTTTTTTVPPTAAVVAPTSTTVTTPSTTVPPTTVPTAPPVVTTPPTTLPTPPTTTTPTTIPTFPGQGGGAPRL